MSDYGSPKEEEKLAFDFLKNMGANENKFFEYWLRPYHQNRIIVSVPEIINNYKTCMKSMADYFAKEDYMTFGDTKSIFVVTKIVEEFENKKTLGLRVIFNKEEDLYGKRESIIMTYGSTLVDYLFESINELYKRK